VENQSRRAVNPQNSFAQTAVKSKSKEMENAVNSVASTNVRNADLVGHKQAYQHG